MSQNGVCFFLSDRHTTLPVLVDITGFQNHDQGLLHAPSKGSRKHYTFQPNLFFVMPEGPSSQTMICYCQARVDDLLRHRLSFRSTTDSRIDEERKKTTVG